MLKSEIAIDARNVTGEEFAPRRETGRYDASGVAVEGRRGGGSCLMPDTLSGEDEVSVTSVWKGVAKRQCMHPVTSRL